MITEIDLKHLDNLPIKVNKKSHHNLQIRIYHHYFSRAFLLEQKEAEKLIV